MIKTVTVSLGAKSYPIYIGAGSWKAIIQDCMEALYQDAPSLLKDLQRQKVLMITDETVYRCFGPEAVDALASLGLRLHTAVVPQGESSKSLQQAEALYTAALKAELDRASWIIALGGGVVGDLAGFIAATYMRGISFLQIPTSLLAQVDSSVGGKVAVNHPLSKNVIGAFHQPKGVFINISALSSLPRREWSTGMAELIKHGFIQDAAFVGWLSSRMDALAALDADTSVEGISRSCAIKASVVSQDEREHGLRAILNFGHTVGHAIEAVAGYGAYTHGEAVAIGMIAESCLACHRRYIDKDYLTLLKSLLKTAGLPTVLPVMDRQRLLEAMGRDKKNADDRIVFVLPKAVGSVFVSRDIEEHEILSALDAAGFE